MNVPPPSPSHQSTSPPKPTAIERTVALLEVLICSDFPTQLALGGTLTAIGYGPFGPNGRLQASYVVALALLDTVVLIGLILIFLYSHGERPRDVIVGRRSPIVEAAYGVPLILVALGMGMTVLLAIQRWAPSLHTVPQNPLEALLTSPRDRWLFGVVVVIAGGIREEVQRAFLLHRFDVWLGGGTAGVLITSVAFGAGHLLQGADAAIATGLLGAFWGVVYLRRRSAVAPMVSHAGFDLMQIAQFVAMR